MKSMPVAAEPPQFQLLDFSNPRNTERGKRRILAKWHQSLCVLVEESWRTLTAQRISLSATKIEPLQFRAALQRFPDDGVAVHLVVGPDRFPSLMVLSRRQVHGILADILDIPGDEWPPAKPFTAAEVAMLDVLWHQLADAVSDSIPGPEPTSCMFVKMVERPERTRLFLPVDACLVGEISLTSRFGQEQALWLLPKKQAEGLVSNEYEDDEYLERAPDPRLIAQAQRIMVDIVVTLGQSDLPVSYVSSLCVGDILVLNQSIRKPLTAAIAGEPRWLGTPIRIGTRQGFEVTRVISELS